MHKQPRFRNKNGAKSSEMGAAVSEFGERANSRPKQTSKTDCSKELKNPSKGAVPKLETARNKPLYNHTASGQGAVPKLGKTHKKPPGNRSISGPGSVPKLGKSPNPLGGPSAQVPASGNRKRRWPKHPKSTQLPPKPVTFSITNLSQTEPKQLITTLVANLTDFTNFLARPLLPDMVARLVFILEKMCSSKTNMAFLNVILSRIHRNLMKQLDVYLVQLSLDEENDKQRSETYWRDPESFWGALVVLFESIIDGLQAGARQLLPKVIKACFVAIDFHQTIHGVSVADEVKKKLGHLSNRLKTLRTIPHQDLDQLDDCYQTINVYPHPDEILIEMKLCARKNITDGSYRSVEHYLDTHFRLLREDFLAPLRKAICTYKASLENKQHTRITEFRVYPQTYFVRIHSISDDAVCTRKVVHRKIYTMISPGAPNQKHVDNSDTFKYGTLLCFSSDNFDTMFFGTVVKLDGTSHAYVDVHLLQSIPFLYDQNYTMLECTNYFNPYYVVLKALQNYDTRNFPMEKYIIKVTNVNEPPAYLTPTTKFKLEGCEFTVLNFESWPAKEELHLNEMQYVAFRRALTSEFVVIQGPPGTGKTYLGLKIAQTWIENFNAIESVGDRPSGPILIVAYTNHALDQFLEGLVPYTRRIVRLGKQCKNDNITKFLLRNSHLRDNQSKFYYERMEKLHTANQQIMEELECALSYRGIFNIKRFTHVDSELRNSQLYHLSHKEILLLLLGSPAKEHRQERWQMVREISRSFQSNRKDQIRPRNEWDVMYYTLSISDLEQYCRHLEKQLMVKNQIEMRTLFEDWNSIETCYDQTRDTVAYLRWRLEHAKEHSNLYSTRQIKVEDFRMLSYNDRWILYFHWLDLYTQHLQATLKRNNSIIREMCDKLEEMRQVKDNDEIQLRRAVVVGMTTSGAARYQTLLRNLKCPIVIVEEAAEVLESHIITSLTEHCQHLVLIGDHQQLQPSTADYQIARQYQLGISLFERMVRNGIRCSTLDVQHRMRPEISQLIVPAIYPNLKNHQSVNMFYNIGGITNNVFFVTHEHPELNYGLSKKNMHEAKYAIALARHLLLQGYQPSQITILTTYKGQMWELRNQRQNDPFKLLHDVRIDVVDNFQGEENEIIILSLVCSNNDGSIGFLAIENRVCVALSRAKKGFYMIGNLNILSQKSKIWPKVEEVLTKNNQVGPGLHLACQLHPENATVVVNPEDFQKVPDGGCSLPCDTDLLCGHVCRKKCHVTDEEHTAYRCMEPCTKILCTDSHLCPKKCWEMCGACEVPVERLLACGHQEMVPCFMKVEEYKCRTLVETVLDCDHSVQRPCFQSKQKYRCIVDVETIHPSCGHSVKRKCHESKIKLVCTTAITVSLKCGHELNGKCMFKDGYSEEHCEKRCLRKLECGHTCPNKCHYLLDTTHTLKEYACKKQCKRLRSGCQRNHKCNLICSAPCEPCTKEVNINLPCGHAKTVLCHESDRKYVCENSCGKTKPCGHICHSKCHTQCDVRCTYKVAKKFSTCDHWIKIWCSQDMGGKTCFKCSKKRKY